MPQDQQEEIRARAHAIWQAEGQPHGLADDHWRQAEAEIAARDGEAGTSEPSVEVKPVRSRKKTVRPA